VWHADQNTGETDVFILNFPTRAFDPAHPDKYRIDPTRARSPSTGPFATAETASYE
jgi:hypothetical protein